MKKQYRVQLTEIERAELKTIIKEGVEDGQIIKRAYILLSVDEKEEGKQMTDKEVSERYQISASTVERLRKVFVKEGLEVAVKGKAYFLLKAKNKKYIVELTEKERAELKEIIKSNKSTIQVRRCHILLGSDVSSEGKKMSDKELSEVYRVSTGTIERLRKSFVEEGLEVAVKGKAYFLAEDERKRYIVKLTKEERDELSETIKSGKNATKIRRAHILLGSDISAEGKQMSDKELSKSYNVSIRTIERLRKCFVTEGFKIALNGKAVGSPRPRKIDGNVEAHLIALTRSKAPDGHQEWNLRLLADTMVALGHVDSLSHESVRQTLKKTLLSPTYAHVG